MQGQPLPMKEGRADRRPRARGHAAARGVVHAVARGEHQVQGGGHVHHDRGLLGRGHEAAVITWALSTNSHWSESGMKEYIHVKMKQEWYKQIQLLGIYGYLAYLSTNADITISHIVQACAMEPFTWIMFHLFLHAEMFIFRQRSQKNVGAPIAYYHHYKDPNLYSKIHWTYIYSLTRWSMINGTYAYLCGIPYESILIYFWIALCDYWAHSFYHTPNRLYVSYNIFSSKFIGIKYFYLLLESVGLCSTRQHMNEHHKDREYEIQNSHDWVDLNIPIFGFLADKFADLLWSTFIFCNVHVVGATGISRKISYNAQLYKRLYAQELTYLMLFIVILPLSFHSCISYTFKQL